MMVGQRHGCGGGDGNTLVGRAEQQVEGDAGIHQGIGIKAAQFGQIAAGVKEAGVEEIRALAARLQRELTKTQHLAFNGKINKGLLIGFHGVVLKKRGQRPRSIIAVRHAGTQKVSAWPRGPALTCR